MLEQRAGQGHLGLTGGKILLITQTSCKWFLYHTLFDSHQYPGYLNSITILWVDSSSYPQITSEENAYQQ